MTDDAENEARIRELEKQITILTLKSEKQESIIQSFKQRSQDLKNRLSVDHRSGLPNHHKLSWFLPERMKSATESGTGLVVVIVRFDGKFSTLSRTIKSTVTNWILYQTGQRLNEAGGDESSVFHSREDEFVIVSPKPVGHDALRAHVGKIIDTVSRPHLFSGYRVTLGCHAGVSMYPEHGVDRHRLMHAADLALENATAQRRKAVIFSEKIRKKVVERMELQSAIIKALESQAIMEISRQFEIFLQPIVGIGAIDENGVAIARTDAEVLIRWNHPTRGMIGPDLFIPTAEETGLIIPIGNWVLYKAVDLLERWKDGPMSDVRLSVNISSRQFHDDQLVDIVTRLMRTRPWLSGRLKLEITESCLMEDPARAVERMERLKAEGGIFSVDDFGTGYSSLSYLSKLPVSSIKIDRSFVRNTTRSTHDLAIIRAVVALGGELSLEVVCEGVETWSELRLVQAEGCKLIQGFFFSRPMPVASFETWVGEHLGTTVPSSPHGASPKGAKRRAT